MLSRGGGKDGTGGNKEIAGLRKFLCDASSNPQEEEALEIFTNSKKSQKQDHLEKTS